MERYLPGAPLSWLVAAGAPAVAAELAQEAAPHDRGCPMNSPGHLGNIVMR